ncbi:MAG: hypothetical protein ACRCXZ_05105, partial [Patescibacteria group bacterium]
GPGTSGSVVIGKSSDHLILGAFVAINGLELSPFQSVVDLTSTPKLIQDYENLTGLKDAESLIKCRMVFPPSAIMLWTEKDFESL